MGILEIILTITAYRKGWKTIALIPIAVTLLVGFMSGLAIKAGGGATQTAIPAFFLGDVVCVVVLALLTARAPRTVSHPKESDTVGFDQTKAA